MRRAALIAAVLWCAPTVTYARTAASLLASCQAVDRAVQHADGSLAFTEDAVPCWSYFEAVQDALTMADQPHRPLLGACVPPTARLTDVIRVFTDYAATHAAYLHDSGAAFALHALREAYPCP